MSKFTKSCTNYNRMAALITSSYTYYICHIPNFVSDAYILLYISVATVSMDWIARVWTIHRKYGFCIPMVLKKNHQNIQKKKKGLAIWTTSINLHRLSWHFFVNFFFEITIISVHPMNIDNSLVECHPLMPCGQYRGLLCWFLFV